MFFLFVCFSLYASVELACNRFVQMCESILVLVSLPLKAIKFM